MNNFIENAKRIMDFDALWEHHAGLVIFVALIFIALITLEIHEGRKATNERCRKIRERK